MDDAEVVELFQGAEKVDHETPIRNRDRDPEKRYCRHMRVELDEGARRCYCRECGEEVPAFDFLLKLSDEWHRYENSRKEAKRLAERAKEKLEDTERRERNAKGRLRTARRKLADGDPLYAQLLDLLNGSGAFVMKDRLRAILDGD